MSKSKKAKSLDTQVEPKAQPVVGDGVVEKKEKKAKTGYLGDSPQGGAIFSPGTHPRAIRAAKLAESAEK